MKRAFATIGFTFAVTLIILNFLNEKWALAAFTVASVLFVVFISVSKTRKAAVLPVSMLSAALACIVFVTYCNNVYLPQTVLADKTVDAQIYIVDTEQKTQNGYSYTVKSRNIEMQNVPQNIKLTVYSDAQITAESYELINVNMTLFSAGKNAFDSRGSFDDGIFLRGYINTYSETDESVGGIQSVNRYFIELRQYLRNTFYDLVGGDFGALSLAVLSGDTSNLSDEAYNNFKACGATHLMAVSGFNLAVLTGMLYKILRRLLVPKVPLVTLCALSVLFYVMLAGFSASMVRAAIMMIVFLLSKLFSEKADNLNSLGFAAFIVCLNPFAVTDAGALLTFTAVLGLIVISPYMSAKIKTKNRLLKSVLGIITASVCVFITTFPVMYYMFGQVSIVGLILNVILIPLSEVLMITAVVFSIFASIAPLASISAFVLKLVSGAMLWITSYFSRFSFSTVNVGSQIYALLIFCVLVIFAVGFFIKARSSVRCFKICTAISCVFAVIITAGSIFTSRNNTFLRIMKGEFSNAVIVYNKDYALVFGISDYEQYYTAKNIIKANELYTAMMIDYDGEYSLKLADECGCLNFVSDTIIYEDGNSVNTQGFRKTLWDGVEISYSNTDEKCVDLKIDNTYFSFDEDELANTEKYDIIYTVNDNGYIMKGVNKWAG